MKYLEFRFKNEIGKNGKVQNTRNGRQFINKVGRHMCL